MGVKDSKKNSASHGNNFGDRLVECRCVQTILGNTFHDTHTNRSDMSWPMLTDVVDLRLQNDRYVAWHDSFGPEQGKCICSSCLLILFISSSLSMLRYSDGLSATITQSSQHTCIIRHGQGVDKVWGSQHSMRGIFKSSQPLNIISAFKKAGIFPIYRCDVSPDDAFRDETPLLKTDAMWGGGKRRYWNTYE